MSETTVLTDEQIQQAVQCLVAEATISGDSVVLKNVNGCIRAIEQAVLQSPEVQKLREDAEAFRGGLKILIPTLEHIANAVDIDLDETRIAVDANGKELASVSISEVIAKLRAVMEKQP